MWNRLENTLRVLLRGMSLSAFCSVESNLSNSSGASIPAHVPIAAVIDAYVEQRRKQSDQTLIA